MKLSKFIILLLLFKISPLNSQELSEEGFNHYTKADGLSNDNVTGIVQDAAGYIWLSTLYGLNRYDGSRFLQYHSSDDSLSLVSEDLTGMTWLDKNRLAVYANGLHIVNTKTGETRNLFIPYHREQYLYKFNMLIRAKGDENGNIYLLTRSGFYHFDKNYKLVFRFDYYSEKEVNTEHFFFGRKLLELDSNRLLITSINALYLYDKRKRQVKKLEAGDCPLLAEFLNYPNVDYEFFQQKPGSLFILKTGSDSLIYVNTIKNKKIISILPFELINEFSWRSKLISINDTLFYLTCQRSGFYQVRFNPKSGAIQFHPQKFFNAYSCNFIMKDKDNNIWIATNKGLFKQDFQKPQVQLAALPDRLKDSFPGTILGCIYVSAGKIYTGIHGLRGFSLFDKKTFRFERRIEFEKQNNFSSQVNAVVPADTSDLLLATSDLLYLFNQNTKKAEPVIPPGWEEGDWTADLHKDVKGNIWIGSSSNVYEYNAVKKNFIVTPASRQLMMPVRFAEDSNGNIWMASHGLARYNTTLMRFDLMIDSFPFIKMPDRQVNTFLIDHENTVWFNSNNNGLIAYDINGRKFRHFSRKDGLPDNNIASMIIINKKLWLATYSGIACMDLQTSQIIRFGKEDGFPLMPIILGANFYYDSLLHQLYISFYNSIARFNPDSLLQKKLPPHLFIESVMVNGEKNFYLPAESITTSWHSNEVMINIGTINFSDGSNQRFAYRIVKDNTADVWQQLGNQNSFSISNLSPGRHTIQVKCFSLNNRWAEQVKEISIVVLPPFWMQEWFVLLMIAMLALLIYFLVKWRISLIRKHEMEKTHIQKLKADDYKNQFELEQISNYFSSSLAGKKTEEEVLWDVTNNLMQKMSYEDCVIYLWNKDKTKMVQKAAYGPKGKPEIIAASAFEVLPGQGVVGEVIQTRKPLLIDDTRTDNRYRVDDAFRLSEVCVPIIHNNELLGTLDSEHSQPGYFGERDIKILTTIATLIGNKLKQLKSEQFLEATQEELTTINEQLAEARLAALQAQMNPHFVFNALNSIKRMILDGENEKASRYLSKFASMIRMTLNHSKEIFVTLDENIQYLKAYLEMEQLRFDDSFSYKIFTDENIDTAETAIPSLMIQPIVENAIWHGLMPAKGDKKVVIKFAQWENRISCIVEDNGIGIQRSEKLKNTNGTLHHSLGLENLQKRIKIINEKYNTACSLEITDLKNTGNNQSGTRVMLQLNIINM